MARFIGTAVVMSVSMLVCGVAGWALGWAFKFPFGLNVVLGMLGVVVGVSATPEVLGTLRGMFAALRQRSPTT